MPYTRKYRDRIGLPKEGFHEDLLKDWYQTFQPAGSGPLDMMRCICALIEEVAELRQIELLSRKKKSFTRKQAMHELMQLEDCGDTPEAKAERAEARKRYRAMTNEELGAELCLSGIVHDEDFGGVFGVDDIRPETEVIARAPFPADGENK